MQELTTDLSSIQNSIEIPELGFAEAEEVLEALSSRVLLYNDNHHTFDEVILQVAKALGCSFRKAALAAWQAHVHGKAQIFEGEMIECLNISSILEEIALHTEVLT